MGDKPDYLGPEALPPSMPYSSSSESATCPSLVDVRSTMEVVAPALSSSHRAAGWFVGGTYESQLALFSSTIT